MGGRCGCASGYPYDRDILTIGISVRGLEFLGRPLVLTLLSGVLHVRPLAGGLAAPQSALHLGVLPPTKPPTGTAAARPGQARRPPGSLSPSSLRSPLPFSLNPPSSLLRSATVPLSALASFPAAASPRHLAPFPPHPSPSYLRHSPSTLRPLTSPSVEIDLVGHMVFGVSHCRSYGFLGSVNVELMAFAVSQYRTYGFSTQ